MDDPLLEVEDLRTVFLVDGQECRAVDGLSFVVPRGKTLAIVGESGCGKTVTAYSILRLIQKPGRIIGGRMRFHVKPGTTIDLAGLDDRDPLLYRVRGGMISMIFQEPMSALSPVHSVGNQILEAIGLHRAVTRVEAKGIAVDMLRRVKIPRPEERLHQYPHEFSGGMRQRIMIAMALATRPQLLIADEPTTALDVTIQAQVLALIRDLQAQFGISVLLITHDLGVVAQVADEVLVMYLGRAVERGPVRRVLRHPRHPYTQGLLASLPGLTGRKTRLACIPGNVPPLSETPTGCAFHPRCPHAEKGRCDALGPPPLVDLGADGAAACLRLEEIARP